jgi:predicted Zn-dependent protease
MLMMSGSCTTDYVTGKKTFSLYSDSQEIEIGRGADPTIVAQYGLYDDQDLAAFIDDRGQALAAKSHRPQLTYTFRVLDSPVVNAFALPGGYVYVTRGILAHFNSEDELAGVLGHEIGHVTARHGVEQMSRQQLAGIGLGLGGAFSDDIRRFSEAAAIGINLMFLSFSRGQESESDRLGVEYSTELGYDANQMADFFRTIGRLQTQSGQSLPNFLSTHPDPGGREVSVAELADEWQQKLNYQPLNTDPDDYLRRIDGIVYGADPRQGFVENQTFYHPDLRFQFPVPAEWRLINTPTAVQMTSPEGDAAVQMRLEKSASPDDVANDFIAKNQVNVTERQTILVNTYTAVTLQSSMTGDDVVLAILSYFIKKGDYVFVFHAFTTSDRYANYRDTFSGVMGGFKQVTDQKVLARQALRLRVEPAKISGELGAVLRDLGMRDDMIDELAIVNGRSVSAAIRRGDLIKVVRQ